MNQLDWEKAHYRRIQRYMKQIDAIFDEGIKEAAAIGATFNANDLFSKPFSFDDYPRTKARIDKMTAKMQSEIQTTVVNGITAEWENSNLINDQIAQRILGIKNTDDIPGKFKKYFNNNNAALQAFINRKEAGMKLSDRVWKYTNGFKKEIEAGLDIGIREGLPAGQMARDLKQYLQHPDKLFRRLRDEHGILQLSKNARQYHPGQGVYRSSYKNAMRLTRTETNMAYRAADHDRIQQLDFVVGIEVRLTNNPGHVYDICDELKGKYPKDFKFTGWHPHCMCHTVTILKTPEELQQDVDKIEEGKRTDTNSQNEVKGLPQNFKDWAEQNKDRIATAKSQPYFIRDNFKGTDVNKWFTSTTSDQPKKQTPTPLTIPKPAAGAAVEIPEPTVMQATGDEYILFNTDKLKQVKLKDEKWELTKETEKTITVFRYEAKKREDRLFNTTGKEKNPNNFQYYAKNKKYAENYKYIYTRDGDVLYECELKSKKVSTVGLFNMTENYKELQTYKDYIDKEVSVQRRDYTKFLNNAKTKSDKELWIRSLKELDNREKELTDILFNQEFQSLSDFERQNQLLKELRKKGYKGYFTKNELVLF